MSIKKGEWSLNQVEKEANILFKKAGQAYIKSKLPDKPNYDKINALCVDILKEHFR
ncbi:MAG: hypothetical protein V2A64_03395 [Candidatus Omnitrophota bacterium]